MPTNKPASPDQVATAVAALRSFWETGRASWGRVGATDDEAPAVTKKRAARRRKQVGYVHGNKTELLKRAAADEGMNHDTLAKAWKASRLYTSEQVEELCGLVERHAARFGPTHLTRVMAVADAKKRDALTRKAVRGRWGVTRLERAVQAVNGRREHVGNRPQIPDARPELLHALIALCEKWRRFGAAAGAKLSDELKVVVGRAAKAVERVQAVAAAELAPAGPTGPATTRT
ncbi:hypothetical protein [Urbifossiella limnaea]|uniref:Uncharacterized protein n=1 Tax=Urbifossiella limnaea TaxID=2528023 RepID=A0A517XU03_9BACT|nr:hypothetical protein [Urbifossiella limnaea]QDU20986.1 hypothetical protein ETAA1_29490 [Urbifossiella limnaea]